MDADFYWGGLACDITSVQIKRLFIRELVKEASKLLLLFLFVRFHFLTHTLQFLHDFCVVGLDSQRCF